MFVKLCVLVIVQLQMDRSRRLTRREQLRLDDLEDQIALLIRRERELQVSSTILQYWKYNSK